MAWAHGTAEPPERFEGPMIDGAEEARLHPDRAMSEPLQRVLRADEPLTLAGVPTGFLPWLAADLARAAHGIEQRRPRGRDRRRRSGDARACRHRAAVRARSRGADPARLGLPALRPRLPGAARHGRAAGDAERAAGQARQAAAAGRHRQRRHAARADAVPHPPAHPPHRRGRADRARGAGRAAERARLPARRHGRRAWRICGARLADRRLPGGRGTGAAARFLRRRDRQPPPLRPRRPALDRQGQGLHPDARVRGPARRGQHQALPLALPRDSSARPRPRTRSTRRCPRAGGWRAWSIGCRCSRSGSTTLFDHLGENDLDRPRRRRRPGARGAARGDRGLLPEPRARDGRRAGQLPPARAATRSISRRTNGRRRSPSGRSTSPRPSPSPNRRASSTSASSRRAISRPSARSRPTSTKRSPSMSPTLRRSGRKVVLASYTRGARERLERPARRPWPQGAEARRQLAGSARRRRPSRRCSSCRSITASPRPTSPCSPSRTCSATASSAAARSARRPPPSSPSWRRSRPATSSSTPTTASAATKGLTQIPVSKVAARLRRARICAAATSSTCRSRISSC